MALQVFKEPFTGKYDGVTSPALLPPGFISAGLNVRKVSPLGGWKGRLGSERHNTTALESSSAINSLHQITFPRGGDYHFIAQCNSKLLVSPQDPPTPAAGTAWTDLGVSVGTTPGFSCMVEEQFFFADGSGRPVAWGGDTPFPIGFLVYDASEVAYSEYTRVVTDKRLDTQAIVLGAATDKIYLITSEPCEGMVIDLGTTVNAAVFTMTVKAWRNGAWAAVSGLSDGTESGGATLAVDGEVTWTRSTSDEMRAIRSSFGYAYEIGWTGALTGSVDVISVTVKMDANLMTNKWNGEFEWVTGCLYYDNDNKAFQDNLGAVLNESTSQYLDLSNKNINDFIYIKAPEPVAGFGFGIPAGYGQDKDTDSAIDNVEYWDGDSWNTVTGRIDTTTDVDGNTSFVQSGKLFFNAAIITPQRRTLEGDETPGYWYRVSWNLLISNNTRVFAIFYAPFPEALPTYDGCVEFKDRLILWGDPEYPNRLRFSAEKRPDCFSGFDSGWTKAFGDKSKIKCALKFYNELIVFKENSVHLMEGYSPATFGGLRITATVGLASPKSAVVAEVGTPGMHQDEAMTIAIWQDTDGVYVLDGRKPRKVSMSIDNYFNQEYSDCIDAADIANRQAFIQPLQNEYHFLLDDGELVLNYATDEWYPIWERSLDQVCGLNVRGTDGRYYTFGGSAGGIVSLLEEGTVDKSATGSQTPIATEIKTRAISIQTERKAVVTTNLRRVWGEFKGRSSGTPRVGYKVFRNMYSAGTTLLPETVLTKPGYGMVVGEVECSIKKCDNFQIEFESSETVLSMEIWSMMYSVEARGYPNV